MVHVDVKKLPAIPDGGGWRTHGRGNAGPRQRAGWRYVHSAIDDRTRPGLLRDPHQRDRRHRRRVLATGRGLLRPLRDRLREGPHRQRPLLPLQRLRQALKDTRTSPRRTRAYRPQTNGKVERFHRILNEEWAYARDWASDTQRCDAHQRFMHHYNEHRPHGALGWTPRWPPSPA